MGSKSQWFAVEKNHEFIGTKQTHRHHRRAERCGENDLCARAIKGVSIAIVLH